MTQTRLLSFDSYRAICDSGNPGARKLGILSETLYQEAAADQQTVLVELTGARSLESSLSGMASAWATTGRAASGSLARPAVPRAASGRSHPVL